MVNNLYSRNWMHHFTMIYQSWYHFSEHPAARPFPHRPKESAFGNLPPLEEAATPAGTVGTTRNSLRLPSPGTEAGLGHGMLVKVAEVVYSIYIYLYGDVVLRWLVDV